MRWTCYQTGKTNSAFSNPHRYVHVCCNFITKNAPSLFLQAIPLCIPYQSLPVNFHFLFSLISLNSKKPPQLPPIRHSNHILFLHLYTLFLLFETKTHKTHFHFLHFWSQSCIAVSKMRICIWVFPVLIVCGLVCGINADQTARTERISGDFTCLKFS